MKLPALMRLVTALVIGWIALPCAAIQITPVISGLARPVFVTSPNDGSNRLFIVEQGGTLRVLQPGASAATLFLDIAGKVTTAGNEQGLLGLAFHPSYATNGRFFVDYTRAGDGAIVISEFTVSGNPLVANTTEKVLLVIPHPVNTNHNGGMLAFGPDGYLYIGVGDGGSANDPPSNAQNVQVLLGKILRIDVDRADAAAGTPYSSPPDNPFVNVSGRDEIFAYGLRNPWRFSFDRATGQVWVGDVGQSAREEVDTPLVKGGNYGWRVFEGTLCTNNDPSLCNPANYIAPRFEYAHTGGRCSITGGYVYRGASGALPAGTYVYGDYCTGEIFAWNGSTQTLLLDTAYNISSFGENQQGELYVVDLNGTIGRIVASAAATTTSLSSSLNPAPAGATVSLTATVDGAAPTGTVNFTEGGTSLSGCSAIALTGSGNSRSAVCSTASLASGTHNIVATYGGDAANGSSSSAALAQVINAASGATNVALASNGGVASASSVHNANFPASAINNNERAGANLNLWSDSTQNAYPDWVQINFSGPKTIDRVVVYTLQDNYTNPVEPTDTMTFSLYGVTDFVVQGWDGANWVTLATVSGNNLVKRAVTFPAYSTDRIRVTINNALAGFSRITEVEAWTSVSAPTSNVALASSGAVAAASSLHNANFPASAINDNERAGSNLNLWSDGTQNAYPDWVQINFSGAKRIDRVVVYTLQDNYTNPVEPTDTMTFSLYGVTDFVVQGWDGANWVTLATVSGNDLVKRTVTFSAYTTDRVRVTVNNALAGYSRITEVEAWGN